VQFDELYTTEKQMDKVALVLPGVKHHLRWSTVSIYSFAYEEAAQIARLALLFSLLRQVGGLCGPHTQVRLDNSRAWDIALAGLSGLGDVTEMLELVATSGLHQPPLKVSTPLFVSTIRGSTTLTILRLDGLNLSTPDHFAGTRHFGGPTRIIDVLASLASLKTLRLDNCKLAGQQERHVRHFPCLRLLHLAEPISSAPLDWYDSLLVRCRHTLQTLVLTHSAKNAKPVTPLQLPFVALGGLERLRTLCLEGRFASADWLTTFADATAVTDLVLSLAPGQAKPAVLAYAKALDATDQPDAPAAQRPFPNLAKLTIRCGSTAEIEELEALQAEHTTLRSLWHGSVHQEEPVATIVSGGGEPMSRWLLKLHRQVEERIEAAGVLAAGAGSANPDVDVSDDDDATDSEWYVEPVPTRRRRLARAERNAGRACDCEGCL
jgi:hypothetical protein